MRILFEESAVIKRKPAKPLESGPLKGDAGRVIRPAEAALGLGLVTRMDLLRLKAIARLQAWGLPPDVDWEDLLH